MVIYTLSLEGCLVFGWLGGQSKIITGILNFDPQRIEKHL